MENCIFDGCGTVSLTFNGTNTASVSSNEFRSNMTMPLSQYPDDFGDPQSSFPAIRLMGSSTGQKVFRANNMGAGWLRLTGVNNWTIGGDTDVRRKYFHRTARVGIMLESGANHITVRRNYSHHVYYGGWSQGNNFELGDCNNHVIVEHNIVRDSSWAVRGLARVSKYNLVMERGTNGCGLPVTMPMSIMKMAGENMDVTGIWMIYQPQNVRFWNNTVDGFGETAGPSVLLVDTGVTADVESCAFLRNDSPSVIEVDGTLTAATNAFYNPGVAGLKNYSTTAIRQRTWAR